MHRQSAFLQRQNANADRGRVRRLGITLIEMVTVITLTGMIGTLTARCVSLLFQMGQSTTQTFHESNTFEQFQKSFRRDVHAAARASIQTGELNGIILESGDNSRVTYEVQDGEILRKSTSAMGKASFEVYAFTRQMPEFSLTESTVLAKLTPRQGSAAAIELHRNLLIVTAIVGTAHRHVQNPASLSPTKLNDSRRQDSSLQN